MANFKDKYGPWAIVTGASSGLGKDFAYQLAEKGLNVVLAARREDRLKALAAELESRYSVEAQVAVVDLSKEDFLPAMLKVTDDLDIGLLINNAGFANSGEFLDNDLESELRLLHVNCRAPLLLTHEYGNQLKKRKKSGIIFVSSVAGFSGIPLWTNYAASKGYDMLFAEGLGAELKKSGIDVLALCPGSTRTEFHDVADINPMMAMDSKDVVKIGLSKLGKKNVVVAGLMNKFNANSTRFLPRFMNVKTFGLFIGQMQKH